MKAQRLSSDRITPLPQTIIETVLCFLPTKEAARTSILSREWRYKWTTIPRLEFDGSYYVFEGSNVDFDDMASERKNMSEICKLFYAIHQVLLLRQGPIHEFALSALAYGTCSEIDQIILHLSRNHPVKKLTLSLYYCDLPLCLFSLQHLTDLRLDSCYIKHKPLFNGFSNLTRLTMRKVNISRDSFVHLLSNCPSLKELCLLASNELRRNEKLTLVELFKCIQPIEHLTTCPCYVVNGVDFTIPLELPMPLLRLKYFGVKEMGYNDSHVWTFVFVLIKCSPNLEKLKLKTYTNVDWDEPSVLKECYVKLKEYSDLQLVHLNELEVKFFTNFKLIAEFVKFILVRSPNLKKLILRTQIKDKNAELEMLYMLLRAPKASPLEIIVENRCKSQQ